MLFRSSERLKSARKLRLATRKLVVQADDAHILLSGTLLGLDETGGAVDADDEAAGDLGVEGAAVAGFFDAEDAAEPCDDFMGGGVGRFVEVDDAGPVGELAGGGGGGAGRRT